MRWSKDQPENPAIRSRSATKTATPICPLETLARSGLRAEYGASLSHSAAPMTATAPPTKATHGPMPALWETLASAGDTQR